MPIQPSRDCNSPITPFSHFQLDQETEQILGLDLDLSKTDFPSKQSHKSINQSADQQTDFKQTKQKKRKKKKTSLDVERIVHWEG